MRLKFLVNIFLVNLNKRCETTAGRYLVLNYHGLSKVAVRQIVSAIHSVASIL